MTTDPNDVEAWLDQFAPEVDRTAPQSAPDAPAFGQPAFGQPTASAAHPEPGPAPAATFSKPSGAPGFSDPMPAAPVPQFSRPSSRPAPAAAAQPQVPTPPQVAPPQVAPPQVAPQRVRASGALGGASGAQEANGLTAAQVGSTMGTAWGEDSWSEETFAQATGGTPAVSSEDFSQGLETPPPKSNDGASNGVINFLLEWMPILIGAAIVAALVRTFVFQAFFIPSGSMMPTLVKDDRVLVNKLSYDFNDVGWGDVIVFKRPPDAPGSVPDLIKRVMALPGDTIEVFNGDVYVNNVRVEEEYLLQQGVSTRLRGDAIPGCIDGTPDRCTVPQGYVFVMGDNRGGSTDSRSFGPIPVDDIVGRAVVRVWPLNALSVF